jgi:hypothetical protein
MYGIGHCAQPRVSRSGAIATPSADEEINCFRNCARWAFRIFMTTTVIVERSSSTGKPFGVSNSALPSCRCYCRCQQGIGTHTKPELADERRQCVGAHTSPATLRQRSLQSWAEARVPMLATVQNRLVNR